MNYTSNIYFLGVVVVFILVVGLTDASTHAGFPGDTCGLRAWENDDGECEVRCDYNEYYDGETCTTCEDPDMVTVYDDALFAPIGSDSCKKPAYCVESDEMCHNCQIPTIALELPPSLQDMPPLRTCKCKPGFTPSVIEVGFMSFFQCQRDCDNKKGSCDQRCEMGKCVCAEGFYLDEEDEETCRDKNECMSGNNDCRLPHICQNTDGGYSCACAPGHVSDRGGQTCNQADGLVFILSFPQTQGLFQMDIKESDFGDLIKDFDMGHIELMFQEVVNMGGAWAEGVDIQPTFVNGFLEIQVILKFIPKLRPDEEVRVLRALTNVLSQRGYSLNFGGESVFVARPVSAFSGNTGGLSISIEDPCQWYREAGYCLQNSECRLDNLGGYPKCDCPKGQYGEQCEFGDMTTVNIVLISCVAVLKICVIGIICYLCCMMRPRRVIVRNQGGMGRMGPAQAMPIKITTTQPMYPGAGNAYSVM